MKSSKKSVRAKATATPELRFEDQRLTSFAGLVILQRFFQLISLKTRLQKCFRHLAKGKIFDRAGLFTQLVIHVMLGYRELRDVAHYQDAPLVQRVLGLKQRTHGLSLIHLMERLLQFQTKVCSLPASEVAERLWQDYQRGGRSDRPRLFEGYELSPPIHNRKSARAPRRQARHIVESNR